MNPVIEYGISLELPLFILNGGEVVIASGFASVFQSLY